MSSQKNIFAIFVSLSIILLMNEVYDLFFISGNLFYSNTIITVSILLTTVLYFNYKQSPGILKFSTLEKFLNKIFPVLFGIFLGGFLIFLIGQVSVYGFAKGEELLNQIFTFIVVLFAISFLILLRTKYLKFNNLS